MSVLVVAARGIDRARLAAIVRSHEALEFLGDVGDGSQAIERIRHLTPDVCVVSMTATADVEVVRDGSRAGGGTRFVVMSEGGTRSDVARAIAAGATGFLRASAPSRTITDSILLVGAGGVVTPSSRAPTLAGRLNLDLLGGQDL